MSTSTSFFNVWIKQQSHSVAITNLTCAFDQDSNWDATSEDLTVPYTRLTGTISDSFNMASLSKTILGLVGGTHHILDS